MQAVEQFDRGETMVSGRVPSDNPSEFERNIRGRDFQGEMFFDEAEPARAIARHIRMYFHVPARTVPIHRQDKGETKYLLMLPKATAQKLKVEIMVWVGEKLKKAKQQ